MAGSLYEKQLEEAMQENGPRVRKSKGQRIVSVRALTPSLTWSFTKALSIGPTAPPTDTHTILALSHPCATLSPQVSQVRLRGLGWGLWSPWPVDTGCLLYRAFHFGPWFPVNEEVTGQHTLVQA